MAATRNITASGNPYTIIRIERTSEKVTVGTGNYFVEDIVTRNVWVDENGRRYVQYKGRFYDIRGKRTADYDCRMFFTFYVA